MVDRTHDWKRFGCLFPLTFSFAEEDLGTGGELLSSFIGAICVFCLFFVLYVLSEMCIATQSLMQICLMTMLITM